MIHNGWTTLTELRTTWSIVDLFDANEALTEALKAEAEARKPPT